ncbi:tail assembly chaperone [Gordonia phage Emperor]|uniref:Tail assembly chaperone n=2 Tax=root TaxID=1 RepID=A0A2Z4Q3S6_9CAUD|nr:hypothetical protein [Gordonia westfalica]YP_010674612.1 tail assembly chaperone [Gordonia phage Emperor]AWY04761.1 tail assembly chaperone [Gordonia phage Emperor]SDU50383.1 hypothetical protein SAMN04488548_1341648 [Gordonia westfalica]
MKITVTLSNSEPIEVETTNPDRVRWDMTAAKHNWPKFTDAPFLGLTFLAWAALRRTGGYDGTWEQFSETDCLDIEADDPEAGEVEPDPTQSGLRLD